MSAEDGQYLLSSAMRSLTAPEKSARGIQSSRGRGRAWVSRLSIGQVNLMAGIAVNTSVPLLDESEIRLGHESLKNVTIERQDGEQGKKSQLFTTPFSTGMPFWCSVR